MMTAYPHLEERDGQIYLDGTGMKLAMLVVNHLDYGWDGDELHENFPYLARGAIYSALAYYYDHKASIDGELEARHRRADGLKPSLEDPEQRRRLTQAKRSIAAPWT